MRSYLLSMIAGVSLLPYVSASALADSHPSPFVYETASEFFGTGDFDGDGRLDVVIVDKDTGKYRLGFQTTEGSLSWVDCRPSGIKGISGFSIGPLFTKGHD